MFNTVNMFIDTVLNEFVVNMIFNR